MVTHYVNTANSVSGDGSTNETDGSGDSAFVSMMAAITHLKANHATLADDHTVWCEGATADTTAVSEFTGITCGSYTLTFQCGVNGVAYYPGEWDTDHYRITSSGVNTIALGLSNARVTFRGIQVGLTDPADASWYGGIVDNGSCTHLIIDACLINITNTNSGDCKAKALGLDSYASSALVDVWNTGIVFTYAVANAVGVNEHYAAGNTFNVLNCTFKNCNVGIAQAAATVVAKNCGFVNCAALHSGTVDHTVSCSETTPTFESGKTFKLDSTDTTWKDQGTDLTAAGYTWDINGVTRGATWDIGADEYVSGATDYPIAPTVGAKTLAGKSGTKALLGFNRQPGKGALALTGDQVYAPTGFAQFARPISDISNTGLWTPSGPGSDLFEMLNEVTPSDTDYIYSVNPPNNATCVMGLTAINMPQAGIITLRVRAKYVS